ncbi:thiosulfate sulfurtransferase SseB [Mycobacterium tuberculosis variant africanum]|nr:thiosulfate sulfurtransferase SseB [Mycobacterium tuberculosis variant africanum]
MQARGQVLITAAELAGMIQAGDPVSILDVRWRLDEPDGHAAYLQGHLPGAVFVSLEDELSDHTIAGRGRHPLPSGRVCKPPSADAESDTMCRSWSTTTGIEPVPRERGGC